MSQKSPLLIIIVTLLFIAACRPKVVIKRTSPKAEFPGLFQDVQSANIFEDSKTFADCIANDDPEKILRLYEEEKNGKDFNLKAFVGKHFTIPQPIAGKYVTDTNQPVDAHINALWDVLKREPDQYNAGSSLINLPFSYVVPGGRFREIYYWDSYFTFLGLQESGRTDLIKNMVDNFSWLVSTYGFIPNGNRTYYLTRSQPPFFALMVKLMLAGHPDKEKEILSTYKMALEIEYNFWMAGATLGKTMGHVVIMPDSAVLNRYYDTGNWPREEAWTEDVATAARSGRKPVEDVYRELRTGAESGWDYSSRWLADGKTLETIHITDIVPVDLNCLLYYLESLLASTYKIQGDTVRADNMKLAATKRIEAIQRYCWDKQEGWFRDYDFKKGMQTASVSLAGMYPFFFEIARKGQADSMVTVLRRDFLKPGGLVTTPVQTGQQWDAPNGWAPLQYMSVTGLLKYHKDSLAHDIATRWTHENIKIFRQTGKLLEKYNVVDTSLAGGGGEYPNQDGFGWTNGVLLKFLLLSKK
ncbi:alpha,alpha-trehalase [Chitinophaga sp. CF118]|uniref:alpha,alpha-trehalase TreF n=1 Tax=Chitinophaga sp. CF118 TaxID=1884367 RepID=UPI0008EEF8FE|nr:alpha,alpha-trehalase TreF [Chitinophaga sp. CF118]SFD89653.1 alpha,alpha-trehalase [Chitinophaga sp. CF118]